MARRDPLFFINYFGWTPEPRLTANKGPRALPMITWPFQDEIATQLVEAWGKKDVGCVKSRDLGWSAMVLFLMVHSLLFDRGFTALIVSRNANLVDEARNHDSLFYKMDFTLSHLPAWMKPANLIRTSMEITNDDRKNSVNGASTTEDVARGGRRTLMMLDEFSAFSPQMSEDVIAATSSTTNCRIFLGTPRGQVGAFYRIMTNRNISAVKIRSHWSRHPLKSRGLYRYANNQLERYDDYEYPIDYPFVLDGRLRSLWADHERKRFTTDWQWNQEHECEFVGSTQHYFDVEMIDKLIQRCTKPVFRGRLDFDADSLEPKTLLESKHGNLMMWCKLGPDGRPNPDHRYGMGADIATGTNSTRSILSIYDLSECRLVAKYADSRITAIDLAKVAVALCKFFSYGRFYGSDGSGAYLVWEANGAGQNFGATIVESGYRNFYYREAMNTIEKRLTKSPGWYTTKKTKDILFGKYRDALYNNKIENLCAESLEECKEIVYGPGGEIVNTVSLYSDDPTMGRDNHADNVVSDALAYIAILKFGGQKAKENIVPPNSIMGRHIARMKDQKKRASENRFGFAWKT